MQTSDSTINGLNTVVTGYPSVGNGTIGTLVAVDSGKGYVDRPANPEPAADEPECARFADVARRL